jgi:LysM repeat protein
VKKLNPFSVPGLLQGERQQTRRKQFKLVVWAVVGANVVLCAGMLIQSCRGKPAGAETEAGKAGKVSASSMNATAIAQQASEWDTPIPPTSEPTPTISQALTNSVPPVAGDTAPNPASAPARQYVVVKGDSLYRIAKANKVSLKALTEANPGIDATKLQVGQVLQLPIGTDPGAAISASTPVAAERATGKPPHRRSNALRRYVVKSGDSLSRIARTHRTTVKAIKAANGLTSDRIVVGQNLKLPESGGPVTSSESG